jgi:PKD repeat protein
MLKAIAFKTSLLTGLIILFAGAFVVPSANSTDLNQGLVGYWKFDEGSGDTAHDYSGSGNDATIHGATWVTNGISGSALDFDGVNDWAQANHVNVDYLTVSAWAYYHQFCENVGWGPPIVSNGCDDPAVGYHLYQNTNYPFNRATCFVTVGGHRYGTISDLPLVTGQWYNLAMTYDGHSVKLYINGQLDSEDNRPSGTITPSPYPLMFAEAYYPGHLSWFDGLIDEVRIYDRALSEAEILYLYRHPGKLPPVVDFTVSPANPVVGDPVTFTSTSYDPDGGSLRNYLWSIRGNGLCWNYRDRTTFTYTFLIPGDYIVTLSLSDDEGTRGSTAKHITVLPGGEKWAVIAQSYIDELGYAKIKDMLCANGWNSSHITNLASDRLGGSKVDEALSSLKDRVGQNDKVLVWFHTHGNYISWLDACYMKFGDWLWDYRSYSYIDVGFLDPLASDNITVVVDACKSGCGIDDLSDPGRVILTGTSKDAWTYGKIFSQSLIATFSEVGDCFFDGNQDGIVSSEEAFNCVDRGKYACYILGVMIPQINDQYDIPGGFPITRIRNHNDFPDQLQPILKPCGDGDRVRHDRWLAQSFKPLSSVLTRMRLYLCESTEGTTNQPLTVAIRKELTGSNLTVAKELLPHVLDDDFDWVEFDFDDIMVTPNETYYIVCMSECQTGGYIWGADVDEASYDQGSGHASTNQGVSWTGPQGMVGDHCFVVFGKQRSSGQTVTNRNGVTSSRGIELIPIDSSITSAEFSISFSGGDLNLSLHDPNGRLINPDSAQADSNISYSSLPTFQLYSISSPSPGEWTMNISGSSGQQYLAQVVAETYLSINMSLDKDRYKRGDSIIVSVGISNDTVSVTGANVTVDVTTPTGSDQMTLYDDGAHGDGLPNDGIYSNYFTSTQDEGSYTFYAKATGTVRGQTFTREGEEKSVTIIFQQPFANAGGPYIADIGEPVQFNGTGSKDEDGIIVNYHWNFGDGNAGTGVSPTHSYSDTGTYHVTLTVTDDNGLVDSTIAIAAIGNPFVQITRPNVTDDSLGGLDTIKWTAYDATDSTDLDIYLYYSPDTGQTWYQIAGLLENTGFYAWSTTNVVDGIYVLKIDAIDQRGNVGTGYSNLVGIINNILRGDANRDGVIDISDVVYLLNYLFIHGPAPVPLAAGDATCDGLVDASDLVYLLNYLFASGPAPSC